MDQARSDRRPRTKDRARGRGRPAVLAALLLLLAAGTLLYAFGRDRIFHWLYPRRYDDLVDRYAAQYELDPLLLCAFIRTESGFDPKAYSDAGARGLMQITEPTFDWIKSKIAAGEDLTFADLDDPATNIRFGGYFVAACLRRYGNDLPTAAAAYHSGWGTVDGLLRDSRYSADGATLSTFPYEQMNRYVRKITTAYSEYQRIYDRS